MTTSLQLEIGLTAAQRARYLVADGTPGQRMGRSYGETVAGTSPSWRLQ